MAQEIAPKALQKAVLDVRSYRDRLLDVGDLPLMALHYPVPGVKSLFDPYSKYF